MSKHNGMSTSKETLTLADTHSGMPCSRDSIMTRRLAFQCNAKTFFSSLKHPGRLRDPAYLPFNGYRISCHGAKAAGAYV